jgi:hypothetical protein
LSLLRRRLPRTRAAAHRIYRETLSRLQDIPADKNTDLSAVAHLRSALVIRPPAFFRHVLFFFPYQEDEQNPALHPGQFDRKGAAERIQELLQKIIKDGASLKTAADDLDKSFKTYQTYIYRRESFKGFELRIAIDIYSEYATISCTLDNHRDLKAAPAEFTPSEIAGYVRKQIRESHAIRSSDEYDKYTDSEMIYFGIWELLDAELGIKFEETNIGSIFGDFRGFAVCPINFPVVKGGLIGSPDTRSKDAEDNAVIPPAVRIVPEQDVMAYLKKNSRFFLNCLGLDRDGTSLHTMPQSVRMEPNLILCKMLGGDAIYGSALGNEFSLEKRPDAPIPITYFIIYNGRSSHQLGRMIRRQHLLGELRLAALLDRNTIMQLGGPVRRMTGLVSHLLSFGTKYLTVGRNEFDEVLSLYIEIGRKCHGGLLYRMSRGAYYFEALQERLEDTRSLSIPGWQSYPGFISRHFDQQFRSMRSIGERYVVVGTRIERLVSIYAAERLRLLSLVPMYISFLSMALLIVAMIYAPLRSEIGTLPASAVVLGLVSIIGSIFAYLYVRAQPREIQRLLEDSARLSDGTSEPTDDK